MKNLENFDHGIFNAINIIVLLDRSMSCHSCVCLVVSNKLKILFWNLSWWSKGPWSIFYELLLLRNLHPKTSSVVQVFPAEFTLHSSRVWLNPGKRLSRIKAKDFAVDGELTDNIWLPEYCITTELLMAKRSVAS